MKNSNLIGTLTLAQVATRATQDYVSPTIAGYLPVISGITQNQMANAGLGVLGLLVAGMKNQKDNTKLGAAVLGSRLLTDVAYDIVRGYIPTTTPTARYSRPRIMHGGIRPVATQMMNSNPHRSWTTGIVTVD